MKPFVAFLCLLPLALPAHTTDTSGRSMDKEMLRQHIADEFMANHSPKKLKLKETPVPLMLRKVTQVASLSGFNLASFLTSGSALPPAGNGLLMQASFAPFKPKVRYNWDGTNFFLESDNTPEGMPNKMVGITTWQQQVPIPAAYFAHSTSNESNAASLGYQQPNVWRIPLVPVPSVSPIVIYNPPAAPTNFLRGAVALASNGIAIFNPSNNGGNVSYEIGELDYYGGHCGLADDYHYHIAPTHLNTRFGGPLGDDKPIAWALDGYPMYGFVEPDGTPRQALDTEGGHDHGGWGYHYHAMGTTTVDATHPYGTPQSPYLMKAFHGTVVNFGNQVDGQPAVGNLRADGSGGYNAKAVAGAYIVAQMNPSPLVTDGSGHLNLVAGVNLTGCATTYSSTTVTCASTVGLTTGLAVVGYGVSNGARVTSVTNATQFVLSIPAIATTTGKNFTAVSMATASPDAYLMRVNMGGVDYDECWTINRKVNPRSMTMTWRAQALVGGVLSGPVLTTTQTYTPTAGTAPANRLTAYPMGAWSEVKLPDTSQVLSTTTTFGEDSDYTTTPSANPQSLTDNGDGTITDNVTGLMWQKADAGEMTWENSVNNASAQTTGGYTDWRLPNPHELMSLFNYETGNPAMNATYFPPASPSAEYWWSRDVFGSSTTNVWCVNSGGGVGPKPKAETVSAGGTLRYHARYVRLAQNSMTHNYTNNLDSTITDSDTSLMWTQMPSAAMTWEGAIAWAEGLTLGGYNDWRMPNIKELQTLTDYSLATTSGGTATNLKPCINRTMFAKTMSGCATTSASPIVTTADTADLVIGMTVIDPYSVAGTYINHATTPTITAINPGVSFTLSSNALATGAGLILRALPRATAYWSSTSNKGTQTEAWLLELGVNNSVPALEGPPRGSQGIISYQAKTASFPVFAVRTATLTTQIAVAQGATSLIDGLSTVAYGNVTVGSTLSKTFTITNTGANPLDITGVTIDGTNSASFSIIVSPSTPVAANNGTSTFTVQMDASTSGNKTAVLHIASSDAGNPSFDINLSGVGFVPPPTISNITINPISPSSTDSAVVTAQVTPGSSATIMGVNLTYDFGAQVTAPAFREIFGNTNTNGLTGSMNTWSTTTVRAAGDLRQRGSTSNHTVPIVLSNCTTNGSTSVTCASTTGLMPGMLITGTNINASTTISQVNSATAITLSQAASGSGSALTLTAAGVTLTSCVAGTAPTINCANTTGLAVGMGLTGSGLATTPGNPTVAAITNGTAFTTNSTAFTTIPATLTASGMALEFNNGTVNYTDTMATSPTIPAGTATVGNVEFWARNVDLSTGNGWTLQISPDGGTTWNTRLTESFASTQASCTLNNANNQTTGSTTILCTDTSKLVVGNTIQGVAIPIASCTTSTTTNPTVILTANTTGLAVGMFITGGNTAGIPNNSRITAISAGVSFTINNSVTASATSTLLANYLAANTTISTITANTSFTVNNAAFYSGSGVTLSCVNHGYKLYHYDLVGADMTASMKLRWQYSGNTATAPARPPATNIDDIVVTLTTGAAPTSLTMFDDGLHGDGAANDGIWGASIPPQTNGTNVNFTIAATGSGGSGTTTSSTTSYTVAPAPTITTASPLPNGNTTTAYNQTLAATGGSGTGYTWSVFSGVLPNGITLSSTGVLSGTATLGGTFNFVAKVTDSLNRSGTKAFALTITASTPPNVVIIITDDQGWGDVGYHTPAGQVPIQTPNMDSFATSGIRLERFYATTVCSVTRSTLATGRNPIRHATNNVRGTDLSEHMMPQTFKAAGYQTFMVGKWHLGGSDKNTNHFTVNGNSLRFIQEGLQYAPFNRGWDSHYGQYSGAIDYYTHRSAETDSLDIPDWWLNGVQQDGPSEHTDSQGHGGWSPDLEADKAIYHIQNRNPNQPMLLHVAFNSIHGPVSAPPELITKYANLGVTNTSRRLIAAAVDGMDQAMGRVLNALNTAGIANNTIVVWFGDNGGDETKGSLNDPLRGDKGDSYEGGLREPAGIRWPGVLPAGVVSNQHIWVGDLFPTLCAATGVTSQNPKPMDGLNMWPALLAASNSTTVSRGAPLVTDQAAPIAIYQYTDPVNGGTKDFKLRRGRVANVITPELFNLTDDPYESTDLIANPAYATIVTSLTSAITGITAENYKPYIGPAMITNSAAQGGSITLYAPFTSYKAPTVQWRKNGSNVSGGNFTQITDSASALVSGSYAATLTLTNVSPTDAGTYDVVITNVGGNTTSESGVLTVTFGAPTLNAMASYTKGTSATVTWSAISGATSYTIQRAATSDFASVLSSQTVSNPTATFTGLTSGTQYFYRATATDGSSTSPFSNTVSSTQDASAPVVTITSPANNTITGLNTASVQGTSADTISPVTGVVVNGVTATTSDAYAHWSATVPLVPGANTITATANDSADAGSNSGTASITVTLNATGPTITSVSAGPTAPTYLDSTYVLAAVTPANGTTISQVQLLYDTGTPVSTKIWQEIFNNTSSNNWNGTGAINAWTSVGAGNVRQAVSTSNHTAISVTGAATTSGSTTVTCNSTANLWPGMLITGPNIAGSINGTQTGNTTIASITNGTTFVLSQAATGSGTGLTLNIASVVLTNATTTAASTAVTCDNTAGLVNGMSLTGTGLANNATVASVTSATTFTMNAVPTTAGIALTLTAGSAAAEFNGGTANLTDSMFTTANAINTSGTAGYIEFWVQTRDLFATNNCGWTMQVSPDNGATWTTRQFEDWNSETVSLTNVVLNSAGLAAGSSTVTCADTTGLTTGRSVLSAPVSVTIGITTGQSTATCTNTTGLVSGMFITATGIPANTRVGTLTPNVSFTLVTGTTATLVNATATNASAAAAATYFAGNATVSSITNGKTFVLNTAAYANTSAAPVATAYATTVNHAAQLFRYDLAGAELGTQTKIRFQATGYTATAPTRTPRISIDDIVVATTAPPPTVTLAMFDDGNHGDGAANDGVWGAAIPAQIGGTTVNFRVVAIDSNAVTSTSPTSSNYTYTVNNLLTDATILGAEFLTLPKTDGVTLNLIASVNQQVFVEYGTAPGQYTLATTPTTFNIDNAKPEFKNPIRIPISGLQPDTEYYYRVRHRNVGAPFYSARGERSFHTARPRGTTFSFTVTADPHIDVNTDMQLFWRAMANISLDQPDIHMDVGDIFMTDKLADGLLGVPPKWGGGVTINQTTINNRAIIFRNAFERACHSIPFFFGLGNHEAEYGYLFNAAADKQNNIPAWDLKARKAFYPAPTPDGFFNGNPTPKDYTGGTLGLLEDYYAFEWGEALFIMLDPFWNTMTNPNSSNDAWNWSLGKTQYDWLRDTLKNSSARYKFVFMHHIVGGSTQAIINGVPTPQFAARGGIEVADKYEWGGKNIDGSVGFATKRPGWDMPIHDLLVLNKVNVVFHGHDHLYGYQTKDGIVYLECPQPGTPNYTSLGSDADGQYVNLGANSTSYLLPNSGHIRVTVGPNNCVADYVRSYRTSSDPMPPDATSVFNDETAVRHNRDISHSFVLAPRISPPIEVANVAPGQVGLRWNAVPNKPYQIQWSTDLVNWQIIDTLIFTNTNTNATYTDGLPERVNGQRAFYRVSYTP
jgi:arylsulfatase A-like enzyme